MRAPLTLPVLVAALLGGVGCVSVREPPPTPPITAQNCPPQAALETLSPSALRGQSGSVPESPRPPTAQQRRALIDKRLHDLRRSQAAEQPPAVRATTAVARPKARKPGAAEVASSGNGATVRDLPARSGDDIVARRLRKAAEQETDPVLKRKLWLEYANYPKNVAGR